MENLLRLYFPFQGSTCDKCFHSEFCCAKLFEIAKNCSEIGIAGNEMARNCEQVKSICVRNPCCNTFLLQEIDNLNRI